MYYLIVSEEQAKVISKALDLFSRIGIGQIEEILKHPTYANDIFKGKIDNADVTVVRDLIAAAKLRLTGYPENASRSIVAGEEHDRIAYDLLQVIEYTLAEGRHLPNGHVARREPMKWSDQELATMRKVPFEGRAGAAHVGDADIEAISAANLPEEFTIKDPKTYNPFEKEDKDGEKD